MAFYKDIQIPQRLAGIIDQMSVVESTRDELNNLGQHWDLLTILGQMSGTGTDMTKTREGFKELTSELLVSLAEETLNKCVQDMTSKAQVAVDIVIRNLFERTADIGFLATDHDIRQYLRDSANNAQSSAQKNQLIARFQEYVAKYSVYYNIVLLDTQGQVLAQLDQTNHVTQSSDPFIREALSTKADYCEYYGESELCPSQHNALIYAYRVTETNSNLSPALGVLCLCFRFENELEGVFANLVDADDWSVVLLLDSQQRTIASSDPHHIPLGCQFEVDSALEFQKVKFAGRAYLAKRCQTKGYQGFFGLGWSGMVLVPVEHAFESHNNQALAGMSKAYLDQVMKQSRLFSDQLQKIPQHADQIQKELDRTVWNGNIQQKGRGASQQANSTKVLLWEVSKTGAKTKQVFEQSISRLNQTVISSMLDDVEFMASLAIDIMDRNLYERANDCRWWALTTAFREILAGREVTSDQRSQITDILRYINDLYTVYPNLLVFDSNGDVLAVSNPKYQKVVGTQLKEEWTKRALSIRNSQEYCVSMFSNTALYDNRPTYIYAASISALNNSSNIVGGIGIVFDSQPEFYAMLKDALPQNEHGEAVEGSFAVFTDAQGVIISSTDSEHAVGTKLALEAEFFELRDGQSCSKIIQYRDNFYALGAVSSKGYREYKSTQDVYRNDVISFVFMLVGSASNCRSMSVTTAIKQSIQTIQSDLANAQQNVELATFYIGNVWLAMRAELVKEALPFVINKQQNDPSNPYLGAIIHGDVALPVINPVLSVLTAEEAALQSNDSKQIVVVETTKGMVGIVVNTLGDIAQINAARLESFDGGLARHNQFIEGVVKPEPHSDSSGLLILVDPNKFIQHISDKDTSLASVLNELAQAETTPDDE